MIERPRPGIAKHAVPEAGISRDMILQGRLLLDPSHLPQPGWLRIEGDRIAEIGEGDPPAAPDAGDADCIITPGFVDAHLHLPQIESIGCECDDLLRWLDAVVYPAEMRWSAAAFALMQISLAHERLIGAGTLAYAGYLTSHGHATALMVQAVGASPLSLVGQSLMDRRGPENLIHEGFAPFPPSREDLRFSVNPRFAVSCSPALLAEAGRHAAEGAFVQTHLAEQRRECALVRELFPDAPHYAGVYDRFGLLTPRTLLAHCVHLDEAQWRLIAQRGSVVVHCPTANIFLKSGLFDLDAARRHEVRLALGSDIAAGADIAMPRVARGMIEVAKARRMAGREAAYVPTPAEAWDLITRFNAAAIGLEDAGRLEAGARADLLVLRADVEVDEHFIGRLLYTWRDGYIEHRILGGDRVTV